MATTKKTTAKRPSRAAAQTDATALLKADHADVAQLFEEYEELAESEADGEERKALAERICAMLTVHATIEEEIFYPAALEAEIDDDLLNEAEVEHGTAKDLIARIQSLEPDDKLFDANVKVLSEYIKHHVEEEEGEMFPKCKKSEMDLADLALQLAERKAELMAESNLE